VAVCVAAVSSVGAPLFSTAAGAASETAVGDVVILVAGLRAPGLDRVFGPVADPAFGLPGTAVRFEWADPGFDLAAEPVGFESADDGLSPDGSAAATGAVANATPSPTATVAATARVVVIAEFIEYSNGSGSAPDRDAEAPEYYQIRCRTAAFQIPVKQIMRLCSTP
jgi:hypothetical protein